VTRDERVFSGDALVAAQAAQGRARSTRFGFIHIALYTSVYRFIHIGLYTYGYGFKYIYMHIDFYTYIYI